MHGKHGEHGEYMVLKAYAGAVPRYPVGLCVGGACGARQGDGVDVPTVHGRLDDGPHSLHAREGRAGAGGTWHVARANQGHSMFSHVPVCTACAT